MLSRSRRTSVILGILLDWQLETPLSSDTIFDKRIIANSLIEPFEVELWVPGG
jgi:hypothetical protein